MKRLYELPLPPEAGIVSVRMPPRAEILTLILSPMRKTKDASNLLVTVIADVVEKSEWVNRVFFLISNARGFERLNSKFIGAVPIVPVPFADADTFGHTYVFDLGEQPPLANRDDEESGGHELLDTAILANRTEHRGSVVNEAIAKELSDIGGGI